MNLRLRLHAQRAAQTLKHGGVVAYPTEAVYGLGCDPCNDRALRRLLKIKRRSPRKGLILIAAHWAQLRPFLRPLAPPLARRVMAAWKEPTPITWLLPARPGVSRLLRGQHNTLAVRITAHPAARALCLAFGGAVVSTSANLTRHPPARRAAEIGQRMGRQLDAVMAGTTGPSARPSEIRDAATGQILRPG